MTPRRRGRLDKSSGATGIGTAYAPKHCPDDPILRMSPGDGVFSSTDVFGTVIVASEVDCRSAIVSGGGIKSRLTK